MAAPSTSTPAAVAAAAAVRPIATLHRTDVALAGGKGANLGELLAAGLPVPDGFVVTAPAYARFADGGGLRARIAARLAGVASGDDAALAAAAADVQRLVLDEPVPAAIAQDVRAAYTALGKDARVAVRSSATAEDTAGASFAQAPSVHPEYADVLVRAGIDAISVSADAVERVRGLVASAEQRLLLRTAATR